MSSFEEYLRRLASELAAYEGEDDEIVEAVRARRDWRSRRASRATDDDELRQCAKCRRRFAVSAFARNRYRAGGRDHYCRECRRGVNAQK